MKLVIYGNGSMARVFHSHARHCWDVAGFTVDDEFATTPEFCGHRLVPFSRAEAEFDPRTHLMITAIGFLDMNLLRERKYQEAKAKGFGFTTYVHPSVMRHDDVEIGENCIILDHTSIHPGSRVGRCSFISSNVNLGHDCELGEGSWLNAGVSIAGGCRIGRFGFFGVNACVAQGLRMGERCFVGANTLINRPTGDDEVYLSGPGEKFRLSSRDFLRFSRMT